MSKINHYFDILEVHALNCVQYEIEAQVLQYYAGTGQLSKIGESEMRLNLLHDKRMRSYSLVYRLSQQETLLRQILNRFKISHFST